MFELGSPHVVAGATKHTDAHPIDKLRGRSRCAFLCEPPQDFDVEFGDRTMSCWRSSAVGVRGVDQVDNGRELDGPSDEEVLL